MKNISAFILFLTAISLWSCEKDDNGNTHINGDTGTVVDIDNNTYKIVKIHDQWWMAENLKTTRYANGDAIPLVENKSEWGDLEFTDKAYCYNENSDSIASIYGALYNWAAAMNGDSSSVYNPSGLQGVCPDGWHLPSNEEWKQLIQSLGGVNYAQGKLKETGTEHWLEPNTYATNESGFTALPGGSRSVGGNFGGIGSNGAWWTSTAAFDNYYTVFYMLVLYDYGTNSTYTENARYGFCVRCVMD